MSSSWTDRLTSSRRRPSDSIASRSEADFTPAATASVASAGAGEAVGVQPASQAAPQAITS
jgi:hypothetical protein